MGKDCKFIYLDEYGNPSAIYAEALEKHGEDMAEAIYIRYMLHESGIKFSTGDSVNEFDGLKVLNEAASKFVKTTDNAYEVQGVGSLMRVTKWLGSLKEDWIKTKLGRKKKIKSKKVLEDVLEDTDSTRAMAENGLFNYLKEFPHEYTNLSEDSLRKEIKRMIDDQDPKYENWINHLINRWIASQKYGDAMHAIVEEVLIEVQKLRNAAIKKGTVLTGKELKSAARNLVFKTKTYTKASGRRNIPGSVKLQDIKHYKAMVATILDRIEVIEKQMDLQPGKLVIRPEQKIYSKKLNLAGSVDILLVNPDTNQVKVMDLKTKTEESLQNFYKQNMEVIGGPYEDMENSAVNKAAAQMSAYAAILEDMGFTLFGMNEVIIVKGIMEVTDKSIGKDPHKQEFIYQIPQVNKIHAVTNRSAHVFEFLTKEDYHKMLESRRKQGFQKDIDLWSGNQVATIRDNEENYLKHRKNQIYKAEESRAIEDEDFYYLNQNPTAPMKERGRVYISTEERNDEKLLDEIFKGEYAEIQKEKSRLATKAVEWFNDPDPYTRRHRLKNKETSLAALLSGISPETHTLEVAEFANPKLWGDLGPDILVARRNDDLNSVSFFSVSAARNNDIKWESTKVDKLGKHEATSLYGNYKTDFELENLGIKMKDTKQAKANDFNTMRLGYAALRYKELYPSAKIEMMKVGNIIGEEWSDITSTSMDEELLKMKRFREFVPKEEFPEELAKYLDDHTLNSAEVYGNTSLDQLFTLLDESNYRLGGFIGQYSRNTENNIAEYILAKRRGKVVDQILIRELADLYNHIASRNASPEQAEELALVGKVLLQLHDMKADSEQLLTHQLSKLDLIRSESTIDDYYIQSLGQMRERYTQQLRMDFHEFNKEHQRKVKALLKDSGVSIITGIGMKKAFKKLMLYPEIMEDGKFDPAHQEDWMTLKDSNTAGFSLAQKEYIEFFNKYIKSHIQKSTTDSRIRDSIEADEFYRVGLIPVMKATKSLDTAHGVGKFFDSAIDYIIPTPREQMTKDDENVEHIRLKAKFESEFTDSGMQYSESRRQKLSIDSGQTAPIEASDIEMNLAVILNNVVIDGLRTEHLGVLNTLANATSNNLIDISKINPHIDTRKSREFLKMWQRMIIHDQFKEEHRGGEIIDMIGRMASQMIFTASYRQALIEFSTAHIQGTSAMIANAINKYIFNSPDEFIWFSPKHWGAAGKIWFSPKKFNQRAQTMVEENGMLYVDPEQLNSPEFTQHNKYQMYESEIMWGANTWSINNILIQTFTAYALEHGIYGAYIKDSETGEWKYDETKDKRFYVYDPELGLGEKPPETEEEKKKHQRWKLARNEMTAEGMIYTDGPKKGRMKVPLSTTERKNIKQYATKLYGSMTKDAIIFSNFYAVGRAMSRYKMWFAQKISNYWTPRGEQQAYQTLEWIENTEFNPLVLGSNHLLTATKLELGQEVLTMPADTPFEVGDILKFGTSDVEYKITKVDGEQVTIAPPITGEIVMQDTPIFVKRTKGYYRWKVEDYEGIIQSIGTLANTIRAEGFKGVKGMGRIQRENFSKLISDSIMFMIAAAIAKFILENEDAEWTQSPVGKTVNRAFGNAYTELFFASTAYGMTDNIFPAVTTFGAQLENITKGLGAIAIGDPEKSAKFLSKGALTFGAVRTATEIGGAIIP